MNVAPTAAEVRGFRFRVLLFLLVLTITFAVNAFYINEEGWLLIDSFYFVWLTMTTVGFGDFYAEELYSQAFLYVFCFFTMGALGSLIGILQDVVEEKTLVEGTDPRSELNPGAMKKASSSMMNLGRIRNDKQSLRSQARAAQGPSLKNLKTEMKTASPADAAGPVSSPTKITAVPLQVVSEETSGEKEGKRQQVNTLAATEPALALAPAPVSVEENEDSGFNEVEEWSHKGKAYLVNRQSLEIVNMQGMVIGKWGEGETAGIPVPDHHED